MDVAVGEGGGSGAGREEEIWLETGWSAWVEGAVEGEAWRSRAATLGDGAGVVVGRGSGEKRMWSGWAARRSVHRGLAE